MAILIVGFIQLFWVSFDEPEKDHLPILPLDPRIWLVVIIVGIFGVIQQLCVIGKKLSVSTDYRNLFTFEFLCFRSLTEKKMFWG